jgi:hypothetical protein
MPARHITLANTNPPTTPAGVTMGVLLANSRLMRAVPERALRAFVSG